MKQNFHFKSNIKSFNAPMLNQLNQRGMSLISVMLASAVGIVVSLAIANSIVSSYKHQTHVDRKLDYNDLIDGIRELYVSQTRCSETFQGTKVENMNDSGRVNRLDPGSLRLNGAALGDFALGKVKISEVSYSVFDSSIPAAPLLKVFFQVKANNGDEINPRFMEKSVLIRATVDASDVITTCQTADGSGGGVTIINPPPTTPSNDLNLGFHSSIQCTSIGGSVIELGGQKVCKFASVCPSGWLAYGNWTATQAGSCRGQWARYQRLPIRCRTGNHEFSAKDVEQCQFADGTGPNTCKASIVEQACY